MKRILLLCSMLIFAVNLSFGQTDKMVFSSEAGKFEANTSRNRLKMYQPAYDNLVKMMAAEIAQNKLAVQKLAGSEKQVLQEKIDNREQYFGEIKALSGDLVKNRVAIKSKLDLFLQTL